MPSGPYHIKPIETHQQFESDPLKPNQLKHHFVVTQQQIQEAGWCDVRIKVHELADQIATQGLVDLNYTDEMLIEDYEKLKNASIEPHKASLIRFEVYPIRPSHMGRRLRYTLFPWKEYLKGHLDRKVKVCRTLNRLLERKQDLTLENVIRELEIVNIPNMLSPGFWRAIFQTHLSVKEKLVTDPYSEDFGAKFLATHFEGGFYNGGSFIGNHVEDFEKINLTHLLLDKMRSSLVRPGSHVVDRGSVLILSNHTPISLDLLHLRYNEYYFTPLKPLPANFEKDTIAIIRAEDLEEFKKIYVPKKVLRVSTIPTSNANSDDVIVIF